LREGLFSLLPNVLLPLPSSLFFLFPFPPPPALEGFATSLFFWLILRFTLADCFVLSSTSQGISKEPLFPLFPPTVTLLCWRRSPEIGRRLRRPLDSPQSGLLVSYLLSLFLAPLAINSVFSIYSSKGSISLRTFFSHTFFFEV